MCTYSYIYITFDIISRLYSSRCIPFSLYANSGYSMWFEPSSSSWIHIVEASIPKGTYRPLTITGWPKWELVNIFKVEQLGELFNLFRYFEISFRPNIYYASKDTIFLWPTVRTRWDDFRLNISSE